jgi:hypothetical protein
LTASIVCLVSWRRSRTRVKIRRPRLLKTDSPPEGGLLV